MKYNFAIAFVIYYPTSSFHKRIELLLSKGYFIYIYDNSKEMEEKITLYRNHENVNYILDKENSGLGYGISYISMKAHNNGFQSLLFFDQDTSFNLETIDFINSTLIENIGCLDDVAVINFSDIDKSLQKMVSVDLVINSGSLFILDNLKKIGWHDKSYFIDGVDYKFCLDAKLNNLKIFKLFSTPGFDHVSEQDDSDYKILGKKFRSREYSPLRVKDYVKSSLKLIALSLKKREYKYGYIFLKYLTYYLLVQGYVRIIKIIKKGKNND